jgi:hypothetical protein
MILRSRFSSRRFQPNNPKIGEDVATVQALMRHANVSVTMNTYVQAVIPAKRKAQRGIIKQIRKLAPDGPDPNLKWLQVLEMVGAIGFEPMTSTV